MDCAAFGADGILATHRCRANFARGVEKDAELVVGVKSYKDVTLGNLFLFSIEHYVLVSVTRTTYFPSVPI